MNNDDFAEAMERITNALWECNHTEHEAHTVSMLLLAVEQMVDVIKAQQECINSLGHDVTNLYSHHP